MQNDLDDLNPFPEPVEIEITDIFDLHTIPPRDVKAVVEEYLREAHRRRVSASSASFTEKVSAYNARLCARFHLEPRSLKGGPMRPLMRVGWGPLL